MPGRRRLRQAGQPPSCSRSHWLQSCKAVTMAVTRRMQLAMEMVIKLVSMMMPIQSTAPNRCLRTEVVSRLARRWAPLLQWPGGQ